MNGFSQIRFDDRLLAYESVIEGQEETVIPVLLTGSDTSGMNRELTYQIISLPKHGILLDAENKYLIQEGDFLNQSDHYPWTGVKVNYIGNKNFFTNPRPRYDNNIGPPTKYESFEFSSLASMPNELKIGRSLSAFKNITLTNINDPTILNVPEEIQTLYRFSSINWESHCEISDDEEDDDRGNGDDRMWKWKGGSSKTCTRDNEINGITVKDPDEGSEFVRVDVRTNIGYVTLNQNHLLKAEFVSCSERNLTALDWHCHGTGIGDKEMTFVVNPTDLDSLFSHMIYESLLDGYDNITISIYDGVGGECLRHAEHLLHYNEYNITDPFTIHNPIIGSSSALISNLTRSNTLNTPNSSDTFYTSNNTLSPSYCHIIEKQIPIQIIPKNNNIILQKDVHIADIPVQLWIAILTLIVSFATIALCTISSKHHAKMIEKAMKMNTNAGSNTYKNGVTKKRRWKKDRKGLDDCSTLDSISEIDNEKKRAYHSFSSYSSSFSDDNEDDNEDDDDNNYDEDYLGSTKDNEDHGTVEWIQHYDASSGNHYYENIRKRRVTWTKPDGPFMYGYGG